MLVLKVAVLQISFLDKTVLKLVSSDYTVGLLAILQMHQLLSFKILKTLNEKYANTYLWLKNGKRNLI